uniref:Rho GTPase activating protein 26 n=1 Tax=Scleropages formosus TaxID=113540 RepID=A0A8C9T591_SCLFO
MGLPALEFSDCYLDSPHFRERLKSHELELDKTNKFIKELIKDGRALIQALRSLSSAKRKFAESLNEFKFQCIGDAETDDEICIAKSLQEFASVLKNLEDERARMIENASDVLITPLERFRKEQIGAAKEARKKYDKETEKYCGVLEKHLSLSAKKKESQLHEADSQVDQVRQHFYEVSLEYVFKVQEVQERKMFEFVEPLLAFLQGLFTYYHHGYELAKDFNDFKTELTISIQNTRNRFESTRSEVECLMKKMKESPHEHKNVSPHTMQGYLFVLEKRSFVSSWAKYYCSYDREPKRFTMVLFDQKSGGKVVSEESFTLKSCTRRKTESIEKRFCFDVEAVDRAGVITMQALSEEDRRLWMEAMDGREPVGFRGWEYRYYTTCALCSVSTRPIPGLVHKLLTLHPPCDVELDSSSEWEIKTITSALKYYLCAPCSHVPLPLTSFLELDNQEARIAEVHSIVHHLPERNRQMLHLLMKHLANVAKHHQQNLMTVANLGVVFGPTLLRPQEETVAAIMDIKFQNIVIEILIENHERVRVTAVCSLQSCLLWGGVTAVRVVWETSPNMRGSELQNVTKLVAIGTNRTSSCSVQKGMLAAGETSPHLPLRPGKLLEVMVSEIPVGLSVLPPVDLSLSLGIFLNNYFFCLFLNLSPTARKARALYACKAEHPSELSFSAGTIFDNVHPSREPGWLEGTLDGRTGLIPENYVEFV